MDYKTKEFSCKQPPLLEIETDHIIPDELHLLLRITDVLTDNLITTAITHDKKDTGLKGQGRRDLKDLCLNHLYLQ